MMGDTVRIGLRNLTRNLRRSLLTGTMMAMGVAALVFFRGYMSSVHEMMIDMVVNSLTAPLQVERRGSSAHLGIPPLDFDLPAELETALTSTPGVVAAAPRIRFGAFLVSGEKSSLVTVLAVDPSHEKKVAPKGPGAGWRSAHGADGDGVAGLIGEAIKDLDDDTIVIGTGLASGLGISLGDSVSLMARTQKGSTDAIDGVVRGINNAGDPELNKRLVIVSLRRAQLLLHMPGRVTAFAATTNNRKDIPKVVEAVRAQLRSSEPSTEVRGWQDLAPYYRDVVILQDDIMKIVMGVVFVLVLSGIVNTMMMSVFERQREIGTLMALGFRRRSIVWLFLTEAVGLGVMAAFIGLALGAAVIGITHLTGVPFVVPAVGTITAYPVFDPGYSAATVVVAMATALVAGLYPAYRASRLQPVEALRAV